MADPRAAELEAIAREVRGFLEPHWADWHRKSGSPEGRRTLSEGTCGRSSRFLVEVLRAAGFEARMAFGSPVECDCGFHSAQGWKGHGWVVVEAPARIIDITADQFGDAPVVVALPGDPRYREGHDIAGEGWIAERQRVARALLPHWQARQLAGAGGLAPEGARKQTGDRA